MKIEYMFTPEEKAELEEIDRQLRDLYSKQINIYMNARVKYLTETTEEFRAVEREIASRSLIMNGGLLRDYGVIKKDGIANIVFEEEKDESR